MRAFKKGDRVRMLYPLRNKFACGGSNFGIVTDKQGEKYTVRMDDGDTIIHTRTNETLLEFMWFSDKKRIK